MCKTDAKNENFAIGVVETEKDPRLGFHLNGILPIDASIFIEILITFNVRELKVLEVIGSTLIFN